MHKRPEGWGRIHIGDGGSAHLGDGGSAVIEGVGYSSI